ncbi:9633_t:CDS:1 [Racocetra persica]|uniref:9633_t:CDS:1 n=1 Tax=Racocetra persica TaxID=160502 RepID=A0ACA9QHX9_9GLOM|nr:9633_t:CDS:1 [Racocetra persica]
MHSTIRGCCTCNVVKGFWTSEGHDLSLASRYYHFTNNQFIEISVVLTITKHKELATKYELYLQLPILDKLKRERHLQCPHDICHLTARKALRFIKITIVILSNEEKLEFIKF